MRRRVHRRASPVPAAGLAVFSLVVVGGVAGWADGGLDGLGAGARTVTALPPSGAAGKATAPPDASSRSATRTAAPSPADWHVVGLGDSVTSGYGCDCDFVADYAHLAAKATGRTVTATNLGVPGQTSSDLLDALTDDGDEAGPVRRADVVVVTIGANDLLDDLADEQAGGCADLACFAPDVAQVRRNVAAVVRRVDALRAGRPTQVLVTDYWNVFEDGSRAVRDHGSDYLHVARTVTEQANAAICAGARSAGATCVDLLGPFRSAAGGVDAMLQDDGDHPDDDGHALIARTLLAAGWPALQR